jgi:hypothetical protein
MIPTPNTFQNQYKNPKTANNNQQKRIRTSQLINRANRQTKKKGKTNETTDSVQKKSPPTTAPRTSGHRARDVYARACGRKPWVRSYND